MDAKDLLINDLQARLQSQGEQLARIEAKIQEVSAQHSAVTEQFSQALEEKDHRIALLQRTINRLLRNVRGSRQERIDPNQLLLFSRDELQQLADEIEQNQSQSAAESESEASVPDAKAKKKKSGRRTLPSGWPKEIQRHELAEEERRCPGCGETRHEMGIETSQQIEYTPAAFKIIEHQRVQYACKGCQEHVVIAPKPPQPIEKGLPGPGLCAHVVLSKFGDHLPLYREEDLFSRMGWLIRRSTICQWLYELGLLVEPLVMRMKHLLLQSLVIHTDDTKIKMLESPVCKEAKFWPYQGDWLHPYIVFDFTLNRSRHGPQTFLADYRGYLQADAYSGYDGIFTSGLVQEVACWAHARRYWHEARLRPDARQYGAGLHCATIADRVTATREFSTAE